VYSESPTRDNMLARIITTPQNIPSEILKRAVKYLTHRIHLCRGQNFDIIEHLKNRDIRNIFKLYFTMNL